MSIERSGTGTRCLSCGKTGAEKQGANNWKMCEKCFSTYCWNCYMKVKKGSNVCTDHRPWGKWLTANGTSATMKFK